VGVKMKKTKKNGEKPFKNGLKTRYFF